MTERLAQLQKLYESDATDPFITYGIALEHAKQQRHDQAIQWLDLTLGIDPNYCYAYFQKAKALSAMDRLDEARRVAQDGIRTAGSVGDQHARDELATLLESID